MVIVKLKGGLGNQLFQYAFGRAVSLSLSQKLYLDISDYELHPHRVVRTYDLHFFKLKTKTIGSISSLNSTIFSFLSFKKHLTIPTYLESNFSFDNSVFDLQFPVIFDGYWQSFKYFESIKSILQDEIQLPYKKARNCHSFLNSIKSKNKVAIHIRRGDYVTDTKTNQIHGICPINYYLDAIVYFRSTFSDLQFLIFSDDIQTVKQEIGISNDFIYIDSMNNYIEEFELMRLCDHFIISNSSFSWWAAWLNKNVSKKVIAPLKWFNDEDMERQTKDLLPLDWIRI